MKSGTLLVLTLGFGSLVLLIGLSGYGAARRAEAIYEEASALHRSYQFSDDLLAAVEADIYQSAIFCRDFLLDPSHIAADSYKEQLRQLDVSARDKLDQLAGAGRPEEVYRASQLRAELDAYFRSMEPMYKWRPAEKLALSALFLKQQVLPLRNSVLEMAAEIHEWNGANFQTQQSDIDRKREDFKAYLTKMLAFAMSLGMVVAAASFFRIRWLERRKEEARHSAERAEHELRRLSQQLVQVQEDERRLLSRELHDEVGQMLTGLRMELTGLERLRANPEQFQRYLEEAKRLTEDTLRTVRDLAMGLRPSMLDDLGLEPALSWQAREFSRRSGVPANVQIEGSLDGLTDAQRTCIYRVVQEALTNCTRHARARQIRIDVNGRPGRISLKIQDDGVGFDVAQARGKGLGLIGIEERAHELGGRVTVWSQPGKGSVLYVDLPAALVKEAAV